MNSLRTFVRLVGAFQRLGHASSFCGAWTGILFSLAAIIYVDDMDLLILHAGSRTLFSDEFYAQPWHQDVEP